MDESLIVGGVVLAVAVALVVGIELARVLQRPRARAVDEPRATRRQVFKGHARSLQGAETGPRALRRPSGRPEGRGDAAG